MSVKFILLGMFAGIMLDGSYELNFKKKIPNIIVQLIFWALMTFVICRAVIVISDGYIPVYTFLFFIIGYSIYYYFLKKSYVQILISIRKVYNNNYRKAIDIILPIQITRYFVRRIKGLAKRIVRIIKSIFKRKKKKIDETDQNTDEILPHNANEIITSDIHML